MERLLEMIFFLFWILGWTMIGILARPSLSHTCFDTKPGSLPNPLLASGCYQRIPQLDIKLWTVGCEMLFSNKDRTTKRNCKKNCAHSLQTARLWDTRASAAAKSKEILREGVWWRDAKKVSCRRFVFLISWRRRLRLCSNRLLKPMARKLGSGI